MQSIGIEMEFVDCTAALGEPGERGEGTSSLEGILQDPLCACEQSVYFADLYEANCDEIEIIYFYHPDYLGSTEFITDMRGEPYQFFLNTPWGDQALRKSLVGFFSTGASLPRWQENQYAKSYTSFSSRFRFNGKEWDEETGNFYYGARYYDPKISVWLSVDPLASKYPYFSPYTFVANNPIMLVDPDGMQIDPASQNDWNKHKADVTQKYNQVIGSIGQAALGMMLGRGSGGANLQELGISATSLKETLGGMAKLEDPNNAQVYSIDNNNCSVCVTHMDKSGAVVIPTNGGSTDAFVHEVTHGIQFEKNQLAFIKGTSNSINSYSNAVHAYKSQAAYGGFSGLGGINPKVPVVSSFSQINKSFVKGIPNVYNGLAETSISPNMSGPDIVKAFPSMSNWGIKSNETLRSVLSGSAGGSSIKWRR